MSELQCQYCGKEMPRPTNLSKHERSCLYGPGGEQAKELIFSMARNGEAPSLEEYKSAKTTDMPSAWTIAAEHGNWTNFIESLGLSSAPCTPDKYRRAWEKVDERMAELRQEHDRLLAEAEAESRTLAIVHDWRPRSYVKNGRVRQELYTVLR